jgi:hypothetical protein
MIDWTLAIFLWTACAVVAWWIAKTNAAPNPGTWAFAGLVFGPIGVLGAIAFAKPGPQPSAGALAVPAPSSPAKSARSFGIAEVAIVILIVVAVIGGGYVLLGRNVVTVASADAPQPGSIWFGESYDPASFAITGRSTTLSPSRPAAMVAALSRDTRDEYLTINVNAPGAGTVPIGGGQMPAGSTLMAYLIPALQSPGVYPVTVSDSGGNVLATGIMNLQ